jgi:ankyrin repeat protein
MLLLQRGADVNIRDSYDKTPLDLARSNGKRRVVRLLEVYSQGRIVSTALDQALHGPPPQRPAPRPAVTWRRRRQYYH